MESYKNHTTDEIAKITQKIEDIEMGSHNTYSLDEVINTLSCLQNKQQKLEVKQQKHEALPIIYGYINSAKTINELHNTFNHLDWDKEFSFLKTRRHGKFDSIFKKNSRSSVTSKESTPTGTWVKIAACFLQKSANLILSGESDLASQNNRNQFLTLLNHLKLKLDKLDKYPLLNLQEGFVKKANEDENFISAWDSFLNHSYKNLHYFLVLQNIHNLAQDAPTHEPLLDPLRYILATVYKQKLTDPQFEAENKIFRNAYMHIKMCIDHTKAIDELSRVIAYLQKDGFSFLKSNWNQIKMLAQKRLDNLGDKRNIDQFISDLTQNPHTGSRLNK